MTEIYVSAERAIAASPEQAYLYVADYRQHHQRYLPPAFSDYKVEEGGVGAGTVVSYRLKLGGRTQSFRARVVEPEPGRVLQERYDDGKTVTTFTVTPAPDGCVVRFESRWDSRGVTGWIERAFAPRLIRKLFNAELDLLQEYAVAQSRESAIVQD